MVTKGIKTKVITHRVHMENSSNGDIGALLKIDDARDGKGGEAVVCILCALFGVNICGQLSPIFFWRLLQRVN